MFVNLHVRDFCLSRSPILMPSSTIATLASQVPPLSCYCAGHPQLSQAAAFIKCSWLLLCFMAWSCPSVGRCSISYASQNCMDVVRNTFSRFLLFLRCFISSVPALRSAVGTYRTFCTSNALRRSQGLYRPHLLTNVKILMSIISATIIFKFFPICCSLAMPDMEWAATNSVLHTCSFFLKCQIFSAYCT